MACAGRGHHWRAPDRRDHDADTQARRYCSVRNHRRGRLALAARVDAARRADGRRRGFAGLGDAQRLCSGRRRPAGQAQCVAQRHGQADLAGRCDVLQQLLRVRRR
ncbi:hypothetical protein G6F35_015067 [Rhizopus arrhizus]|nr:hypothetical protein G6F35_015067 [Rhizopus arrhizus]